MRVVVGGIVQWLWRAVNEHGEVLDVLLQEHRDKGAAKRFFRRLIDDQEAAGAHHHRWTQELWRSAPGTA